jgi:oligoribonuclease NrnB/cAMP/cGMP phosphodiesterase (DHH superfamily)
MAYTLIETPKQKIIVIYHGNCPDGFGAAWAAWTKFKNKAAYLPAKDRLALPCEIKNKEVYVLDYTYEPALMKKLIEDNIRVTAIDHHISQEVGTKMTQNYSYDLKHSAAPLTWSYFHPKKKVPMLLKYVEDRDLWNWKVPYSEEILTLVDLSPFDFKVWNKIANDLDNTAKLKIYKKNGALLLKFQRALIEKLLPSAELVMFDGKKVWALNAPYYFSSDLGHELAMRTKSFAIIWSESAGRIRVSLRAASNIDVSKIAQKYGGGGHKAASGFSFLIHEKFPWEVIS